VDKKDSFAFLPTKLENMKATQNLVERRILAPLTIVKDSAKGRQIKDVIKERKKRVEKELAKFDQEIISRIPPEKLAQLLENQVEEGDSESIAASLRNEIKQLVSEELMKGGDTQTQKEIVSVTPQTTTTPTQYTQVPLQHAHNNGQNGQQQAANL